MKATKANKEYTINPAQADQYAKAGFDILGDDGEVVRYGAGKTVPYERYKKLLNEKEALEERLGALETQRQEVPEERLKETLEAGKDDKAGKAPPKK